MQNNKPKDRDRLDEAALANERMGDNDLQGNDQADVRNQRHTAPSVRREADEEILESFERMDKDERAKTDLGKGGRQTR